MEQKEPQQAGEERHRKSFDIALIAGAALAGVLYGCLVPAFVTDASLLYMFLSPFLTVPTFAALVSLWYAVCWIARRGVTRVGRGMWLIFTCVALLGWPIAGLHTIWARYDGGGGHANVRFESDGKVEPEAVWVGPIHLPPADAGTSSAH